VLPYIRENEGLSESEARFLVSAFFYTYAFGQIPCGWLSDRFGTRLTLAIYLAIWSALTGLMGLAEGFVMLVAFRFGCGLFEAGAYPACAGLIRHWVPYEKRGLASGVVSIGGAWRHDRPAGDRLPHGPLPADLQVEANSCSRC